MTETQNAKVDTPCSAYNAMASEWPLIDDLVGGSGPMQAGSAAYLPKFDKEETKHYNTRVANSILFSAYGDTVKSICGKPFSKALTMQGDLPAPLDELEDNVDGQGKSLSQLAKDIFFEFVNRGMGHILVDFPETINEDGTTPNLQEERAKGLMPRFINIKSEQLIGWRTEKDAGGKPVLTRIRIAETQTEPDGMWGEKQVNYVRVIEPHSWRLYRQGEKDKYILETEGVNSLGKVPLVTGYANQTGFMVAEPPLKELAETNLAHYRSDSDQRNILHMARTITLFVKGFTDEDAQKIALGPNQIISTLNPEGDAKFLEHSGNAIDAGAKDVEKLEERMMMLGLQPFLRKTGNQTATGQSIDESRANSDIQAWVMSLEKMLKMAFEIAAEWIGAELPDDFKVDIFNDFAIWVRALQDVADLTKIRQAGELSRTTFLREIKKRALLSETLSIDEEVAAIEAEGPALGMVGLDDNNE